MAGELRKPKLKIIWPYLFIAVQAWDVGYGYHNDGLDAGKPELYWRTLAKLCFNESSSLRPT